MEHAPETELGRALFDELLLIHGAIRRDLDTIQALIADVLGGRAPDEVQAQLKELEANGPLWQLKVNCLRYCRFVHLHHTLEDTAFFPALRSANPTVGPVIDRLEAEHRKVSDDLDEVEAAAGALTGQEGEASRRRLATALQGLADNLLAHLDYEELSAGPTIRRLQRL